MEVINTPTPNIKSWFGSSKVVDREGKPQEVYHGSRYTGNITKFFPLSHFGSLDAATDRVRSSTKKNIYSVYLRIENPLHIQDKGEHHGPQEYLWAVCDSTMAPTPMKQDATSLIKLFQQDQRKYLFTQEGFDWITNQIVGLMTKYGFDGFVYSNWREGNDSKSWVILSPTQCKIIKRDAL